MNQGIILGIDFSPDYTQVAVIKGGNGSRPVMTAPAQGQYLTPSAMFYNTELKEWSAGIEALNRGRVEEGVLIDALPERMKRDSGVRVAGETVSWSRIASGFLGPLIEEAAGRAGGAQVKHIVISADDPDENLMRALFSGLEMSGYGPECLRVISHAESFAYYILNQSRDIWTNTVLMVDFNEIKPALWRIFVTKGRQPYVADVTKKDISDVINCDQLKTAAGRKKADEALCFLLESEISERVVSAVYLNGQGFMSEGWYQKTIEAIRDNRRLFAGNNLTVKGVAYAAREFFCAPVLDRFVIACKGRTNVNVSMDVVSKGTETKVILSRAGTHWYEAGARTQCILDRADEADFTITWPATGEKKSFSMDLSAFPKRTNKTVRVEVSLSYTDEHTMAVEIKDIGFGEFYPSSGVSVRHEEYVG